MDKDFVLEMANTIKDQLVGMTPLNVIRSWGIENFVATEYKGMAALKFHVQGRLFSGNVIIAYNAFDYYEVYLQNYAGTECIGEEVYFDELGRVIDEAIERGKEKPSINSFFGRNVFHKLTTYDYKNIYAPIHRGCP